MLAEQNKFSNENSWWTFEEFTSDWFWLDELFGIWVALERPRRLFW